MAGAAVSARLFAVGTEAAAVVLDDVYIEGVTGRTYECLEYQPNQIAEHGKLL